VPERNKEYLVHA